IRVITPTGMVDTTIQPADDSSLSHKLVRIVSDGLGSETTSTTSEAEYDSRGRVIVTRTTGLGGVTLEQRRTYDANGFLDTEELPHPVGAEPTGYKTYDFDELGTL